MTSPTMTEASIRLRTSQPSISRMLTDLERDLNLQLFERRHGRISPTPEGLKLYEEVERSFIGLNQIHQFAAEIRNFREGQVTVAAMPALCLDLVPNAVASLLAEHPNVRVAVHTRSSRQVVRWMISGEVELGLANRPFDVIGVDVLMAIETATVCVLPKGHPLAGKAELAVTDLKDEKLIVLSDSNIRTDIESAFLAEDMALNPVLETTLSVVAARFVELGLGIAIIDPFSARFVGNRDVVVKPLAPRIPIVYGLLKPATKHLSLALSAVVESLSSELASWPLPDGTHPRLQRF